MKIKLKKVAVLAVGLCFVLAFSMMYIGPTTACRRHRPRTIYVAPPTGDPSIDTVNIQAAFDKATEHRGWTVKLRAGTYVIGQPIEVVNFDGTFKGAGKCKTVIQNMDGFHLHPELGYPVLLYFYQNPSTDSTADDPYSIRIQDFTIELIGGSEPWYFGTVMNGIEVVGIKTGEWDTDISYFDVFIKRVGFIGQPDPEEPYWYNSFHPIVIAGEYGIPGGAPTKRIQGTYIVTDCSFEHSVYGLDFWGRFEDSKIIVNGNTFNDVLECFFSQDASNSVFMISHNTGTNVHEDAIWIANGVMNFWYGASDFGLPWPELSKYIISHNYFSSELRTEADVIMLVDWAYGGSGNPSIQAYVYCNDIYLDDATGGAIFTAWIFDSWFVGNTISGHGFMGIYIGIWRDFFDPWWGSLTDDSSGNKILFNDVSDLTVEALAYYGPDWFDYDPVTEPVAGIWLGPFTSGNLVVHHGDTDDVTDLGSNTIIIF